MLVFLVLLLTPLFVNFVVAQTDLKEVVLGRDFEAGKGSELVTKVLVGVLFILLFYSVLSGIFLHQKWIALAVSIIVTYLGLRFVPADSLQALFLPTSAFILAGSLVLQFALILYVNSTIFGSGKRVSILRTMMWYLWGFGMIYLWFNFGLYSLLQNWGVVDGTGPLVWGSIQIVGPPTIAIPPFATYMYLVAIFAALLFGSKLDNFIGEKVHAEEFTAASSALADRLKKQQVKRKLEAESVDKELE